MEALDELSDTQIRAHIDPKSFTRGHAYFRAGRIVQPRRVGTTLKAGCQGSMPAPYQVTASVGADGEISAFCSCPVGAWGRCKHVAALLLTWIDRPNAFAEVEDLETALGRRDKEELLDVIRMLLRVRPDLEALLETSLSGSTAGGVAIDPATVKSRAAEALDRPGYGYNPWDDYGYHGGVPGIYNDLYALVAGGDASLAAGDYDSAASTYRAMLEAVMEHGQLEYDEEGEIVGVAAACTEKLGECLDHVDDPAFREQILDSLFEVYCHDVEEYGGIGLADGVPEILSGRTTPDERRVVAGWLRDAMPESGDDEFGSRFVERAYADFLLSLEAESLDDEGYIAHCREFGLDEELAARLLDLGREEEAVDVARSVPSFTLSAVTGLFDERGQGDLIEGIVRDRLGSADDSPPGYHRGSLEDWLKSRYRERGDHEAAFEIARRQLQATPWVERYREVEELAAALGWWEKLRPEILAELGRQSPNQEIQIHLEDGEIDEAIEVVRSRQTRALLYHHGYDMRLKVAEAAEETRPEAAIEIYQSYAEELIDRRGRENYQAAAGTLARARDLYDGLDRFDEWEAYIERLRAEHKRLWALREELNNAGL